MPHGAAVRRLRCVSLCRGAAADVAVRSGERPAMPLRRVVADGGRKKRGRRLFFIKEVAFFIKKTYLYFRKQDAGAYASGSRIYLCDYPPPIPGADIQKICFQ